VSFEPTAWARLADRYPWPDARPSAAECLDGFGVREEGWEFVLDGLSAPLVVEVGVWCGQTSRWLLERDPGLRLIAVDRWVADTVWGTMWQRLIDAGRVWPNDSIADVWRVNLWDLRARCLAVHETSRVGMTAVAAAGVQPDVAFIDAAHRYEAVLADCLTALRLWPRAIICGDDYCTEGNLADQVRPAVHDVAQLAGLSVAVRGRFWRYE